MPTDYEMTDLQTNGVRLRAAIEGQGPLVILVHGWPELWYSWRHQIRPLAEAGYRVVAPDVRGYGGSDKPHAVEAYDMLSLTADMVGLIDALGEDQAVLIGHDWGAPICWTSAVLYPDRIRAVAGLSVPFFRRGPVSSIELFKTLYAGKFFYQLYFQEEGVAEAEFEADVRTALRKIYYFASGDAGDEGRAALVNKGPNDKMLEDLPDPEPFPAWLSEADLSYYVQAFEQGGFRGPLNRYRCQQRDWELLPQLSNATIEQPSFFVAGSRDLVRHFIPGTDLYANPGVYCGDFRGKVIIEDQGHWVQQETPPEVTEALLGFLADL